MFNCDTDDDFSIASVMVKVDANNTKLPISISIVNDVLEEGEEHFTLQLSYDDNNDRGNVDIVREFTTISVRDDDGLFSL